MNIEFCDRLSQELTTIDGRLWFFLYSIAKCNYPNESDLLLFLYVSKDRRWKNIMFASQLLWNKITFFLLSRLVRFELIVFDLTRTAWFLSFADKYFICALNDNLSHVNGIVFSFKNVHRQTHAKICKVNEWKSNSILLANGHSVTCRRFKNMFPVWRVKMKKKKKIETKSYFSIMATRE